MRIGNYIFVISPSLFVIEVLVAWASEGGAKVAPAF